MTKVKLHHFGRKSVSPILGIGLAEGIPTYCSILLFQYIT